METWVFPLSCCCCSATKSYLTLCDPMDCSITRLPWPSPSPTVCPGSCPLNLWCNPTIQAFVALSSFCLQPFPASGSFPINQLSASGGQSIRASASASVLSTNIQGWFPLRLTGFTSISHPDAPSHLPLHPIPLKINEKKKKIDWFDLFSV